MAPHTAVRTSAFHAVGSEASPGTVAPEDIDLSAFAAASGGREAAQRALDLVVATALTVVFAPLALLVAAVLAASVGGSLFEREQRVGRDGRVFSLMRFRTLAPGAARRHGVARLIWVSRLDELPQLLNVLCGDMSIVGPRPETPQVVQRLARILRGYELRHLVRPGITGWSQAMGQWSAGDDARRLAYDLYYVRHRSAGMDLRILLRTAALLPIGGLGR